MFLAYQNYFVRFHFFAWHRQLYLARNIIFELNQRLPSEIMEEIISNPVDGYVTQVQQCPNISETVLSIAKVADKKHRVIFKSAFIPSGGEIESLVFSSNFHSKYDLKDKNETECLTRLLNDAEAHIGKGEYSKIKYDSGKYIFSDFTDREIQFVKSTIITGK